MSYGGDVTVPVRVIRTVSQTEVAIMRAAESPYAMLPLIAAVDGEALADYGSNFPGASHLIPAEGDGPFVVDATLSQLLHTELLGNGTHNLVQSIYTLHNGLISAVAETTIEISNPTTTIGFDLTYQEIRLVVGETLVVGCRTVDNNGSFTALESGSIAWSIGDSGIATVTGAGETVKTITAIAEGNTTLQAIYAAYTRTCRVVVTTVAAPCKHHALDGAILDVYTPGRSYFPMSIFQSSPNWLGMPGDPEADPVVFAADLLAAGLDAETGVSYGVTSLTSLAHAQASFNGHHRLLIEWYRDNGLNFVGTGDDLWGHASYLELLHPTQPWASDYSNYFDWLLEQIHAYGICPCIETVDEAGFIPDVPNITPDDQDIVNAYWMPHTPRPAVTWPAVGSLAVDLAALMMGPGKADYATFYTLAPGSFRRGLGFSLPDQRITVEALIARRELWPVGWCVGSLVSVEGPFYRKWWPAADYVPLSDPLIQAGNPADIIAANVFGHIALGATALRYYDMTTTHITDRANAAVNTGPWPTACDPRLDNDGRWDAMSAATNMVRSIGAHFFQPLASAVNAGRTFLSGARSGTLSNVLIVINYSDIAQPGHIDLTPYLTATTTQVWRIIGATSYAAVSEARSTFVDTFQPGEARVYVMAN